MLDEESEDENDFLIVPPDQFQHPDLFMRVRFFLGGK
jgi:hypothetical protein